MSQETQKQIIQLPKIVTVKNARLFFDNKRQAYRLVHYNNEILTVKIIEPITGTGETTTEVINIFPVSESSKTAISMALSYIGIKESIYNICENLDIDINQLGVEFWGFDPFKRYGGDWNNRPSTVKESGNPKRRINRDWDLIEKELLDLELPEPKSNLKYYLLEGFDGNDITFKKVVKSATYEKLEKHIKKIFNSCGIRKFDNVCGDPDGFIAYYRNGETRLAITIYPMEFKDNEDKTSQLDYYRKYYNGVYTI